MCYQSSAAAQLLLNCDCSMPPMRWLRESPGQRTQLQHLCAPALAASNSRTQRPQRRRLCQLPTAAGAAELDTHRPGKVRNVAALILNGVAVGVTQPAARAVAKCGLVNPLLEVSQSNTF
jgi:hypothetical protein